MRHALSLILLVAVVACSKPPNYPYEKEPDPRSAEYVLGIPDVVRIRVWGHNDLNTEAQIRPDGTVTLPLAGDVSAVGKTPTELREEIAARLSAFVKLTEHSVTVEVAKINSYRVTVTGNVEKPGVIDVPRYLTVSEAITLAGGPNRFADSEDTVIVRTREDGSTTRIPIRYDLLEEGVALEQDIVLLSGDLVYVP